MFEDKMFDVEHALSMYASSYVVMPASAIYDDETLRRFAGTLATCHIYLIGLLPEVEFLDAKPGSDGSLTTIHNVAGRKTSLSWKIPLDVTVQKDERGWFLAHGERRGWFTDDDTFQNLNRQDAFNFEVLYIGQAYGKDGSRSSIDRLLKHETLQKISVKGIPVGYTLAVLLLEIEPANRVITLFNPRAKIKDQGETRIDQGLDKLFNTNEAERVTLFEASLIRYFQPVYNKEFKDSFPSTNMKILADCYSKDFSSVVAEVCFEQAFFKIFSPSIKPSQCHTAQHDLHEEADRKIFFS